MRHDHLVLLARARWRVALVLFLLAAALSVWLMSASNEPRTFYCGNAPVEVSHSYSDYYLWVDTVENMVHLRVSYFD